MPSEYVLITCIVIAGLLGGIIGAEREYRAKIAGTRTHLLVAVGAALMMVVSRYGFDGQGDPGRVAAQIVSGIATTVISLVGLEVFGWLFRKHMTEAVGDNKDLVR